MLERFLSPLDSARASHLLRRLGHHRVESWALTGGLAIEIQIALAGVAAHTRSLNDLDFIAADFADVPETLAKDFVFRHVHPAEVPGRTMMQLVDVDARLGIDVFRATGRSVCRASQLDLPTGRIRVVSLEDLIARTARLSLNLASGVPIPAKHAADFVRLSRLKRLIDVQPVWRDHRKPDHPKVFKEASDLLHELIRKRSDLLIVPQYSKDVSAVCPRCVPSSAFPLADPRAIVSALGYC